MFRTSPWVNSMGVWMLLQPGFLILQLRGPALNLHPTKPNDPSAPTTLTPSTTDAEGKDAAAGEANRKQLATLLDEAEQQLSRTPFLAGEAYSVADVMFTPVLFRLGMANKTGEYLKPRPNVSSYFNR